MADELVTRPLRTSSTIAAIAAALAKAQAAYVPVRKDKQAQIETRTGGRFSYAYVDLATIAEALRGPLAANELAITQAVAVRDHRVLVETSLLHASGEWLASELALPIGDSGDPRSVGSAITYARRFSLCALVGIAAGDEDDDAAAALPAKPRRESSTTRGVKDRPAPRADQKRPSATAAGGSTRDQPDQASRLSERQRRLLFATARDHGWTHEEVRDEILRAFGVHSTNDLQREDLDQLLNLLQRRPRVARADAS